MGSFPPQIQNSLNPIASDYALPFIHIPDSVVNEHISTCISLFKTPQPLPLLIRRLLDKTPQSLKVCARHHSNNSDKGHQLLDKIPAVEGAASTERKKPAVVAAAAFQEALPGNDVSFNVKNVAVKDLKHGYVASNAMEDLVKEAANFISLSSPSKLNQLSFKLDPSHNTHHLLDGIPERISQSDLVSWSSILSGLVKKEMTVKDGKGAHKMFDEMLERGIESSEVTIVVFILDDGTGKADVNTWVNETSENDEIAHIKNGMYMAVNGSLKRFQGKKHVDASSVRSVLNFEEITPHFFEGMCMLLRTRMVRGLLMILQSCTLSWAVCTGSGLCRLLLDTAKKLFVKNLGDQGKQDFSPLCQCIQIFGGHSLSVILFHHWSGVLKSSLTTEWSLSQVLALEKAVGRKETRASPSYATGLHQQLVDVLGQRDSLESLLGGFPSSTTLIANELINTPRTDYRGCNKS